MPHPGPEDLPLLFVYGSLLGPTGIPRVDRALALCVPGEAALARGRLYDLGAYPGAVPDPGPLLPPQPPLIRGRLLRVTSPEALADLDAYEGHDPLSPGAGEFARAPVEALVPGPDGSARIVPAQIYWYTLPVAGRDPVPDGDWARARRLAVFKAPD